MYWICLLNVSSGPNVSIGRAKYVDKNEVDSEQRIRKKEKEIGLPPYDVYSVTIEILLSLT
jgi:hypothetical protein